MGARYMQWEPEGKTVFQVFHHTIDYTKVILDSGVGAGGRPFTVPDLWYGGFRIYIGPTVYWNVLVHELTHVWQGINGPTTVSYIFNSILCQAAFWTSAYDYTLGEPWDRYGCEQQAQIVEDWWKRGHSTSDAAFHYIRDHVWKGDTGMGFKSSDFENLPF